jgi:hypothetical protein
VTVGINEAVSCVVGLFQWLCCAVLWDVVPLLASLSNVCMAHYGWLQAVQAAWGSTRISSTRGPTKSSVCMSVGVVPAAGYGCMCVAAESGWCCVAVEL